MKGLIVAKGKDKKSKKGRKHKVSSCKCPDCTEKRSAKKQTRKRKKWERKMRGFLYKGKERYATIQDGNKEIKGPGFLAGGHPKLKNDCGFHGFHKGGYYTDPLSPLHERARPAVRRILNADGIPTHRIKPGTPLGIETNYYLYRAYQIDLPQDSFDALSQKDEKFQKITWLWHGTPDGNISSIAHKGFRLGSRGLLGGGIYTSPDIDKAISFGRGVFTCVLLCAVRLGRVWHTNEAKRRRNWLMEASKEEEKPVKVNRSSCRARGCDSALASAGVYNRAWASRLLHSEYCCYDDAQVLPVYALVFTTDKERLQ